MDKKSLAKRISINTFDLLGMSIIVLAVVIGASFFWVKPADHSARIYLTVKTTTPDADVIYEAAKEQKQIYLNGVNVPVSVAGVTQKGQNLFVTVDGSGRAFSGGYIFNGQRVLIGQKAEIHGRYFAQGIITYIGNENY